MVFCCTTDEAGLVEARIGHFERVKRSKTRLILGNNEFRFVSFNVPNLFFVEDKPDQRGSWIPTDPFEVSDALATISSLPGRVVRSYTLGIGKGLHIEGLRTYNEDAFVAMDRILAEARRTGVRLIIPLVNNHFGGDSNTTEFGFGDYGLMSKFRGRLPSQFFSHPELIQDFEHLVTFLLTRINSLNGIRYADDETILAWETGNELGGWDDSPPPGSWTVHIARFIKNLSPNVLVIDGTLGGFNASSRYQKEALRSEFVDGFDNHYYGGDVRLLASDAKWIHSFGKVFVAGEFGFGSVAWTESFLNAYMKTKMSGCLLWSLRFHSRDGGSTLTLVETALSNDLMSCRILYPF
jgi:endo-1,4-beta-mannosidase